MVRRSQKTIIELLLPKSEQWMTKEKYNRSSKLGIIFSPVTRSMDRSIVDGILSSSVEDQKRGDALYLSFVLCAINGIY